MIIESPTNPLAQLEVERSHMAARITPRPLDHVNAQGVAGGHFRLAARSGALTAAGIVADAPLFSLRWTSAQYLLLLTYLEAYLVPTAVFTAAQELGVGAVLASGFTASDSAGTAVLPGVSNRARRGSMQVSQIGDMRIGSTTLLTAGTRTLDANDFITGAGLANVVNVAAGTQYVNPTMVPQSFGFKYEARVDRGEHPIVLTANEGIIVRNKVAFPAAGTATLIVNLGWAEVPAY